MMKRRHLYNLLCKSRKKVLSEMMVTQRNTYLQFKMITFTVDNMYCCIHY